MPADTDLAQRGYWQGTQAPWRKSFDVARTPYDARVALGIPTAQAWNTFTPVITANSGAFTTVSGVIRYLDFGKIRFIALKIAITTNGTAGGWINSTLPPGAPHGGDAVLVGRETALTGKMVVGNLGGGLLTIVAYDNSYPGLNGAILSMFGTYELA